jgi:CRP-like cAMP-binding protein
MPFGSHHLVGRQNDGAVLGGLSAGHTVFAQGDPANAIFFIHSGKIKISVVSDLGKEAVVALLNPGQFFGEGALAGQPLRISTAMCLSQAVISRYDLGAARRLIRQDFAFRDLFLAHLLDRSVRAEADLIDQLFNPSERRLARLLLLLANYGTNSPPQPVIASISQEMLAQMIGTTRARVSFFMNRFRSLGYISYDSQITVHPALLAAMRQDQAGTPPHDPDSFPG